MQFLIYGANGYTGELVAREAVRRGHRPVLAGRNADAIAQLARELDCESRVFGLDAIDLRGVDAVIHCAGPFVHTSKPMVDACLAASVHYLDITGEIAVFEAIFARDAEAKSRNIALLPGVGFDVVPSDCLAAMLATRLPEANTLALAFYAKGTALSRGTAKTMLESIGDDGAIRRDGRIVRVPVAFDVRDVPFTAGTRTVMTIPWGDVATAFRTTGIPNIRTYFAAHPKTIANMKRMAPLMKVAGLAPIRRLLQWWAGRKSGPDDAMRAAGRMYLWGEVSDGTRRIEMTMTTPEGYAFTALSAVRAVETLAAHPRTGALTPALAFGAEFVTSVPGVIIGTT